MPPTEKLTLVTAGTLTPCRNSKVEATRTPTLHTATPNDVKETTRAVRQAAIRQEARQCHQQQELTPVTARATTPRRNSKAEAT
jgi:hypothetical protein